jgi:hypothetical protein
MKLANGLLTIAAVGAMVALGGARSPAAPGFSTRNIKGAYASVFQGVIVGSGTPEYLAGTSIINADGKGNLSGHESFVFNGTPCSNVTMSGTYSVNSDGSGSNAVMFSGTTQACSGSYTQEFSIGGSGQIVVLSNSNAGNEVTETWRQQGLPF